MELLGKIGLPLSWIYGAVVKLRNFLFDIGFFKSVAFKTTTVCIGNLSVGGTGKTPMTEFILEHYQGHRKLAVLSRGYGRKSTGTVRAVPGIKVEDLGDEPYQIYTKFPDVTVVVDADRRKGIRWLENEVGPDMILLDDAFQHRKVLPTFSILLTSFGNPYTDDLYLPSGRLRDDREQAKRAHIIIVTKCPLDLDAGARAAIVGKLRPEAQQQVLFSGLEYDLQLKGTDTTKTLHDLSGSSIRLVTGIADPGPLVDHLGKQGISFEHLRYADHHFFTQRELDAINAKGGPVLTTEKDYMRLKGKVGGLYYIGVRHKFLGDDKERLITALDAL
ncbi:MAG: tetraacyldisaccharide 4'-kinase [Sediminicola sp.]